MEGVPLTTLCQRKRLRMVNHAILDDFDGGLLHGFGIMRIEFIDHRGIVMPKAGGYVNGQCSMFCQFRGVGMAKTVRVQAKFIQTAVKPLASAMGI